MARSGPPRREDDQAAAEVAAWIRNVRWGRVIFGVVAGFVLTALSSGAGFYLGHIEVRAQAGNAVTQASTAVKRADSAVKVAEAIRDTLADFREANQKSLTWVTALSEALAADACRRDRFGMRKAGIRCEELEIPRALMRRP